MDLFVGPLDFAYPGEAGCVIVRVSNASQIEAKSCISQRTLDAGLA